MDNPHQRSWVEVSASAFAHNIAQLKTIIPADTLLAPVIKANAYGHGIVEMGVLSQDLPVVDWLCVGLLSDALTLRAKNITKPILVTGSIDIDPAQALGQNIHLMVYSLQQAVELSRIAAQYNGHFPIHIKIDTGLSRIGFSYTNVNDIFASIVQLAGLRIVGVYSHFAEAQAQDPSFGHLQRKRFSTALAHLEQKKYKPYYIHIANSAATMRFTIPECNLVRIGAAVYGLWPSEWTKAEVLTRFPNFTLRPVLTWKTKIMHIQQVPAGSFIGYNRTHQVTRDSNIAILPIGYQDGYDIQFSNRGCVGIGEYYAPVVGRICMNHLMVDVTDVPTQALENVVTLVGHKAPLDVYSMAVLSGNNNIRELLTHINPQFERKVVL